jgi:hypothetical protein
MRTEFLTSSAKKKSRLFLTWTPFAIFLASRFSLLASRFSLLASRFSLLASRFSLLASRFSLLASRSAKEYERHDHEERYEDGYRPRHETEEARHWDTGRLGDGLHHEIRGIADIGHGTHEHRAARYSS